MNLIFASPVFKQGINLTVRRGDRWSNEKGNIVHVCDKSGNILFDTEIKSCRTMKFSEITDDILVHEHEPSCRTVSGLLESMKQCYPGFSETDTVTMVYFLL
jgi:hypothetical protein